ncbi:amidase family protein [Tardiphaga sp. 71_E8_N1_1]|uniref:amidase family protein n=1 Tax=Tardiphaga sp. 71_E8_N1_1 TaxID=3240784 RepID=UPI003F8C8EB3
MAGAAHTSQPNDGQHGFATLTLVDAAILLQRGDLTSEAYTQALLEACARQAGMNAFIAIDPGAVLDAARAADRARHGGAVSGPLHGVPLAIKDNIHTGCLRTSAGTVALKNNRPPHASEVVRRLKSAGAIVLGKTNMHELAMGWTGNNPGFGRVANPHGPAAIAGGSSSGSAAAVAAFMAPAAIGTDTNGSIRIPAALCGIVGLRPSMGRYPVEGIVPLAPSLDTLGPMARTVADVALLDRVMRGVPAASLPRPEAVRIGVSPEFFLSTLDTEVAATFEATMRRLQERDVEIVVADIPSLAAMVEGVAHGVIAHEAARSLPQYLAEYAPQITMRQLVASAGTDLDLAGLLYRSPPSMADLRRASTLRKRLQDAYRSHFQTYRLSALLHPVPKMPAPPADVRFVSPAPDVMINGNLVSAREAFGGNVTPASLAGCPVLALPAGHTRDGRPIGVALEALPGDDDGLLLLGADVERMLGFASPIGASGGAQADQLPATPDTIA